MRNFCLKSFLRRQQRSKKEQQKKRIFYLFFEHLERKGGLKSAQKSKNISFRATHKIGINNKYFILKKFLN